MLWMVTTAPDKTDDAEKVAFSARLNEALDDIRAPEKYKGRQLFVSEMISGQGGKVSQKGARKWLECEAIPAMDNLVRLARGLNVSLEWLATGRGTKRLNPGLSDDEYWMLLSYRSLNPEEKGFVKGYVAGLNKKKQNAPPPPGTNLHDLPKPPL